MGGRDLGRSASLTVPPLRKQKRRSPEMGSDVPMVTEQAWGRWAEQFYPRTPSLSPPVLVRLRSPAQVPSAFLGGLTCLLPSPPGQRAGTWTQENPSRPAGGSRLQPGSEIHSQVCVSLQASLFLHPLHPHGVCQPTPWLARVCVGGSRVVLCQGSRDGGGALSFLLFITLGLWGGFPWPPPPPREGEGVWVSHRLGAGTRGKRGGGAWSCVGPKLMAGA